MTEPMGACPICVTGELDGDLVCRPCVDALNKASMGCFGGFASTLNAAIWAANKARGTKAEEPKPIDLGNLTTYSSGGQVVQVGTDSAGDIYETYIDSPAEARRLAGWLLGWSDWRDSKK